jgi:hypothetical protein
MERNARAGSPEDPVVQEARRLWGDNIAPISSDAIAENISDGTRWFLTNVGLPTDSPFAVNFYHDEQLLEPVSVGQTEFLALGEDHGTVLGVRAGTDELWTVHPAGIIPQRFVNSRLSAFILFLGLYVSRRRDLEEASDDETLVALVQEIREQFTSRDAPALADPENWWSLVLEQASEGWS